MGDARHNPRSTQYAGPLPESIVEGGISAVIEPRAIWIEMMKPIADEARAKGLPDPVFTLSDEDKEVVFYLQCNWTVPMRTSTNGWPQAQIRLIEMHRMPFTELKGRVREAFLKTNPALAATIDPPKLVPSES